MTAEEWRPVVGYDGYDVSNEGRVRSRRRKGEPKVLKPALTSAGYPCVCLSINPVGMGMRGFQATEQVAKVVLEAFGGKAPSAMHQARHIDGDRMNSRADNLAWKLPSEHGEDQLRRGTVLLAELNHKTKLDWERVRAIQTRIAAGDSNAQLGREYGVTERAISDIRHRITWKYDPIENSGRK